MSETTTPEFQDEMQELTFKQLNQFIAKRNDLVGMANAATGDRVTLTESLTESSDDPEIIAAREARDEAIMLLHKLVTPKVEEIIANSSGELETLEAKIKDIDTKLKPGLNYYKKVYGDEAAEHFSPQARLKGLKVGPVGGGGRRIRGYKVETTVDDETTLHENFASAAKYLDVDTTLLQDAFFTAAGNPKQVKDAPDRVEFSVQFTEVDEDGNESVNSSDIVAFRETEAA